jgi:hypothetical protein
MYVRHHHHHLIYTADRAAPVTFLHEQDGHGLEAVSGQEDVRVLQRGLQHAGLQVLLVEHDLDGPQRQVRLDGLQRVLQVQELSVLVSLLPHGEW